MTDRNQWRAISNKPTEGELIRLVKHMWLHENYDSNGRSQMTTREKEIYDFIINTDLEKLDAMYAPPYVEPAEVKYRPAVIPDDYGSVAEFSNMPDAEDKYWLKSKLSGCVMHQGRKRWIDGNAKGWLFCRIPVAPEAVREFRIYDMSNPSRKGLCRSHHTHFDVMWDDGYKQYGVLDLSDYSIAKLREPEPAPVPVAPEGEAGSDLQKLQAVIDSLEPSRQRLKEALNAALKKVSEAGPVPELPEVDWDTVHESVNWLVWHPRHRWIGFPDEPVVTGQVLQRWASHKGHLRDFVFKFWPFKGDWTQSKMQRPQAKPTPAPDTSDKRVDAESEKGQDGWREATEADKNKWCRSIVRPGHTEHGVLMGIEHGRFLIAIGGTDPIVRRKHCQVRVSPSPESETQPESRPFNETIDRAEANGALKLRDNQWMFWAGYGHLTPTELRTIADELESRDRGQG